MTRNALLFLLCFLLASCGGGSHELVIRPKNIVIVLCDVSNSISFKDLPLPGGNIGNVENIAASVPSEFSGETDIYYYPVSDNANAPLLTPAPIRHIEGNGAVMNQQNDSNAVLLGGLNRVLDSLSKSDYRNSCIITSLQHAASVLQVKIGGEPRPVKPVLVIISDMKEFCTTAVGSPLNMEHLEDKERLEMVRQHAGEVQFSPDFSGISGLTVIVKNCSPRMTGAEAALLPPIWDTIFSRVGYKHPVIFEPSATLK